MIRAIAIDDEQMALDVIITYCKKLENILLLKTFVNPFKALEYIRQNDPELIFLDINMPDISGLHLAETLGESTQVIFTTAYREHAVASYDLEATDFLAKPFSLPRFIKAIEKAQRHRATRSDGSENEYLFLKSGYEQHKVNLADIHYVTGAGNYMEFVTSEDKVLSRLTISETKQILPDDDFIRVHKSYIVSIRHIDRIVNQKILIGDAEIPIGQSYREGLFARLKSVGK